MVAQIKSGFECRATKPKQIVHSWWELSSHQETRGLVMATNSVCRVWNLSAVIICVACHCHRCHTGGYLRHQQMGSNGFHLEQLMSMMMMMMTMVMMMMMIVVVVKWVLFGYIRNHMNSEHTDNQWGNNWFLLILSSFTVLVSQTELFIHTIPKY